MPLWAHQSRAASLRDGPEWNAGAALGPTYFREMPALRGRRGGEAGIILWGAGKGGSESGLKHDTFIGKQECRRKQHVKQEAQS